jgi:hypothetical protein
MPFPFRSFINSEGRIRTVLGYLALVLLPPLVMLIVVATKFQGLQAPEALDHAQLARHLAAGDGYTTSFVRPLSLLFRADIRDHPDLYNAPVHPLLLSWFYQLRRPSDRMTACVGLLLWLASIWLTFFVACIWWSEAEAAIATLFYGCSLTMVMATVDGLAEPMMAVWVTLAVFATVPLLGDEEQTSIPSWRLALIGALAGCAFLTEYALITVSIPLFVYVFAIHRRKWRVVGMFALGFLIPLLPWMWRNMQVTGAPFFSLYWYELMSGTGSYPGESVWRTLSPLPQPLVFPFQHPLQMAAKIATNFAQFRVGALSAIDPLVAFLFVASLVGISSTRRWRHVVIIVATGLLLCILGGCVLKPDVVILVAWLPVVAIVSAHQLVGWLQRRLGHVSFEGIRVSLPRSKMAVNRHEPPTRFALGRFALSAPWARLVVCLLAVAFTAYPLCYYIIRVRPDPTRRTSQTYRPLAFWLPPDAVVMTDQPAFVAWYSGHVAVLLCQREEEFNALEKALGPVDAVFVTQGLLQMTAAERGDWWSWVMAPRGVYDGLAPAERMPTGTMLRVRPKTVS